MSFLDDIKDSISDFANKAADKLIPKELAPFLPIAGAFAPGLGGVFASQIGRFLIPQLLTAASSAKMQGEIAPTQQIITGILSALQTPTQQTGAEKALLEQNPELLERAERARTLEDAVRLTDDEFAKIIQDPNINIQGYQLEGADRLFGRSSPLAFDVDSSNILKFTDPTTGQDLFFNELSPGFKDFSGTPSLNEFLEQTVTKPVDIGNLTGQELIDELSNAEGFSADTISGKLADIQKAQGGGQGLVALNKARQFFDSPIGFNAPPFAKVGVGSAPFLAAQAANLKAEQEALEAEEAAEAERFAGARDDLFDYFRRLSDPQGLFTAAEGGIASLPAGMPQGMQVDGRNGTFIPMGVKEKADDVPAMLSKNEFVMTADAVRAAGGGSVEKGAQRMYDLMNSVEARA